MVDYRDSHVGADRGELYDERYQVGAVRFYWDCFEMPLVENLFGKLSQNKSKRYLDFAVGTGRIMEIVSHKFSDIVGVDVSKEMLEVVEKKVPSAKLILFDVTTDHLDIGKFDAISCFRFILNAEPELREKAVLWLRTVISQDGILVINNHLNSVSLTGVVCRLSNIVRRETRHNILSETEVQDLLFRCGFQIEERYSFGCIPAWRNRLWLPRRLLYFLEKTIEKITFLRRFGKNRIFVCSPSVVNRMAE